MILEIKALSEKIGREIPLPYYATDGAAAVDLHACIDAPLTIPAGGQVVVPTGLAVAIPALVAYNLFARWTRLLRQDVEGFVTDMHGYAIHNVQQLAMVDLKPLAATKISSGEKG